MIPTQLLITFTKQNRLQQTVEKITNCYTLAFNKIYVLENATNSKELICSYNIDSTKDIDVSNIPSNTISVHRKKEVNCMYTINALNYIISLLNDGHTDPNFPMPWEKYRNCILVSNNEGFKKTDTKIHSIINL